MEILPKQSSCSFWLQQPLQQELCCPGALFFPLKQSVFNRDLHCFTDSFSGPLRFLYLSSSSDILKLRFLQRDQLGEACAQASLRVGVNSSVPKRSNCLMGCPCQCLLWQLSHGTLACCSGNISVLLSPGDLLHPSPLRKICHSDLPH